MPDPYKGFDLGKEPQSAPSGRNHLLVIAIDEYAHCPKLYNCVKDAREFIEVLTEKYRFEPENVTTLFNAGATRPNIHTQLKKLKSEVGPEDNLVVYFSGHGETEDNVGYWAPVNAHPGHEWEYFSTDEIKRRLDAIDSFHTFVIVDACFSGSLFTSYKSAAPGYESKRSRWGLAASHSRERALDGTAGENSPFAATLLHQLRGSRDNLPVQDLAAAVIRQVEQATEGRQTPVFKPLNVKGDDSGQYVFRLRVLIPAWQNAWAIIEPLPEDNITQLNTKILRLDEYVEQFPFAENLSEVLALGERLEYKCEFFQAQNSLFRLRIFARKETPFQQQALHLIEELKKGYSLPMDSESVLLSNEEEFLMPPISQPQSPRTLPLQGKQPLHNTFTDPRDGQTYRTVELNGQRWMAQNLNYDVGEGCWFYNNDPKNGEKYGRLYTWEAAKKACPPGWRLPTDEEWKALAMKFGGYYDWPAREDVGDPKKSYKALLEGGNSGFSALLGGRRDSNGGYLALDRSGFYWSATEYGTGGAWYYNFYGDYRQVVRFSGARSIGLSCRCLKD